MPVLVVEPETAPDKLRGCGVHPPNLHKCPGGVSGRGVVLAARAADGGLAVLESGRLSCAIGGCQPVKALGPGMFPLELPPVALISQQHLRSRWPTSLAPVAVYYQELLAAHGGGGS